MDARKDRRYIKKEFNESSDLKLIIMYNEK